MISLELMYGLYTSVSTVAIFVSIIAPIPKSNCWLHWKFTCFPVLPSTVHVQSLIYLFWCFGQTFRYLRSVFFGCQYYLAVCLAHPYCGFFHYARFIRSSSWHFMLEILVWLLSGVSLYCVLLYNPPYFLCLAPIKNGNVLDSFATITNGISFSLISIFHYIVFEYA